MGAGVEGRQMERRPLRPQDEDGSKAVEVEQKDETAKKPEDYRKLKFKSDSDADIFHSGPR